MNFRNLNMSPFRWSYGRVGREDHGTENHDIELTDVGNIYRPPSSFLRRLSFKTTNQYTGWRRTVMFAAGITICVLLINIILYSIAINWYPANNGVGTIYTGDCGVVKRWNTILHLFINLLSTCLLAASSFTMQCLASPTRSEVDKMHAKRRWMDIGLPSLRNIRHIKKKKAALWLALCLSTLPLHLFFNSTLFATIGAMKFTYIVVDESFLSGAEYLKPDFSHYSSSKAEEMFRASDIRDPAKFLKDYQDGLYTRLTVPECLAAYSGDFVSSYRNLIAVTRPETGMRMSPGIIFPTQPVNWTEFYGLDAVRNNYYSSAMNYAEPLWNGSSVLALQGSGRHGTKNSDWICKGWVHEGQYVSQLDCSVTGIQKLYRDTGSWSIRTGHGFLSLSQAIPQKYPVDYCLAQSRDVETCQLQYVPYIMIVVIVCNVIKVLAMGLTARYVWNLKEPILATVGDALESFITVPDPTTKGYPLMSLQTVETWTFQQMSEPSRVSVYNRSPLTRIYHFTTKTRWWVTMTLCFMYVVLGYGMLGAAASAFGATIQNGTLSVWQAIGLGVVKQDNTLAIQKSKSQFEKASEGDLLGAILIANSFQVVLSITYFLFNSLWTAQCAAKEWAEYAIKRKPLRVTWPRGSQNSTYYLQLPYRYAVPLIGCLALLHFFISQSIYLARVQFYNADGTIDESEYIADASYSPLGILCTVIVATVLLITMVIHSLLKCSNVIPPHGNCSAVISAMCHQGNDTNETAEMHHDPPLAGRPLQWGVVRKHHNSDVKHIGEVQQHCAFSADEVEQPVIGNVYY